MIALLLWLAACTNGTAAPTAIAPSATAWITPTSAPTETATSAPTAEPSQTPASTPSATPGARVCSPLVGYALKDLAGMIFNPYHPPPPGLDTPHEGIDLAVTLPGGRVALQGNGIAAALSGRVVAVIKDRFPYGNAALIETPLEQVSPGLVLPTAEPTLAPRSALTCPAFKTPPVYDLSRRSLYAIYAHMQNTPDLKPGDEVSCGQEIGKVGMTGNALNPHLHFEVRVGPGGLVLPGMAHYDNSATPEEMSYYCLWRVSGLFQLVDPMKVLEEKSP